MDHEKRFLKQSFLGSERRGYHHGRLKDALIEAARSLIAQRGPAGFTLAEAAKLVGVTAAAPYRHFSDREDLMGELARRGFEQFAVRLSAAWDAGRPDPMTAFRRMGTAYLGFAKEEPGLYTAMFSNAANLKPAETGAAGQSALDILIGASAVVLQHSGASVRGARTLAMQIWTLSHGAATLMLGGHLDAANPDCDPHEILMRSVTALVQSAVEPAASPPGRG